MIFFFAYFGAFFFFLFWLHQVLVVAHRTFIVSHGSLPFSTQTSSCGVRALEHTVLVVVVLELSSCGAWAALGYSSCSVWP